MDAPFCRIKARWKEKRARGSAEASKNHGRSAPCLLERAVSSSPPPSSSSPSSPPPSSSSSSSPSPSC
eukprot:6063909-Pyramimonas_sp.AAC.1